MRWRIALVSVVLAGLASARLEGVRYLRWAEIQQLFAGIAAPGEKRPEVTEARQWDAWIRQRDAEIRGGIDHGIEDSISMLIIYGTSFTAQSRLRSVAEAVNAAEDLTPAARARLDAFIEALDRMNDERFRWVLQFLRRRLVTQDELRAYLSGNLRRAALEPARESRMNDKGTASPSGSAIEETLRTLKSDGKTPGIFRRIGVIGPGLEPKYDPDDHNLFESLEATLRLGMAKPGAVDLVVLDLNPWVLSLVRAAAAKAGATNHARISAQDLNVVTQTIESVPGQGFDLMIASNGLGGYSHFEQTLVMANVAQMMARGGVFLANSPSSGTIPQEFEALSATTGEGITAYRRR